MVVDLMNQPLVVEVLVMLVLGERHLLLVTHFRRQLRRPREFVDTTVFVAVVCFAADAIRDGKRDRNPTMTTTTYTITTTTTTNATTTSDHFSSDLLHPQVTCSATATIVTHSKTTAINYSLASQPPGACQKIQRLRGRPVFSL